MELTPVTCNHCGAALQVPDSARFVTCRYCNSQLEIKRSETAITTEVLQHLDQTTTAMADDLHALRRDAEIERLDREWNQRQQALFVKGRDGAASPPNATMGYILIFVLGGFGVLWTIIAGAISGGFALAIGGSGAPGIFSVVPCVFPLFGIFFIVLAITLGVKTITAAGKYQEEQRQYQLRREQLIASLPEESPTTRP